MDKELVGGIIALLTAIFTVVRMLMSYWFKQSRENDKLKHELTQKSLQALELSIDNHKILLKAHAEQLKSTQAQIKDMVEKEAKTREAFGRIADRIKDFVTSTEKHFNKLDAEVIELRGGMKMFKGAKNAKTD